MPTVKEKAEGLHKIGAELRTCSCFYRQQSAVRKQVQEGRQSSLSLSLNLRVWDTVPGSLGSFQGGFRHHVLHLEIAQKWSRLD